MSATRGESFRNWAMCQDPTPRRPMAIPAPKPGILRRAWRAALKAKRNSGDFHGN